MANSNNAIAQNALDLPFNTKANGKLINWTRHLEAGDGALGRYWAERLEYGYFGNDLLQCTHHIGSNAWINNPPPPSFPEAITLDVYGSEEFTPNKENSIKPHQGRKCREGRIYIPYFAKVPNRTLQQNKATQHSHQTSKMNCWRENGGWRSSQEFGAPAESPKSPTWLWTGEPRN